MQVTTYDRYYCHKEQLSNCAMKNNNLLEHIETVECAVYLNC